MYSGGENPKGAGGRTLLTDIHHRFDDNRETSKLIGI